MAGPGFPENCQDFQLLKQEAKDLFNQAQQPGASQETIDDNRKAHEALQNYVTCEHYEESKACGEKTCIIDGCDMIIYQGPKVI